LACLKIAEGRGSQKAKRIRGPHYNGMADYGQLLQSAGDAKQKRHLSPAEYQQTESTWHRHVEARRQFNAPA
jgi:hypothetical protein